MCIGIVHHIGYLVKDIDKSITAFQVLGYELEKDVYFDGERMINFCFMIKEQERIELVEPEKESDIFPLLKTYKNRIYHVCYEVEAIEPAVDKMKSNGFLLFRDRQRASAISEDAVVVFMIHRSIGIIELVQFGH